MSWLSDPSVKAAAQAIAKDGGTPATADLLRLAVALSEAAGDARQSGALRAELGGYDGTDIVVPPERSANGFAVPFPVRALGTVEPEEIFLGSREKFTAVSLALGQSVAELEHTLVDIGPAGVLGVRVPARQVVGDAAETDDDAEVYIYILARELDRVVSWVRGRAMLAIVACIAREATA